jgi:peptidoglycan hydrolase-like protein with peptidoglycan-binding domain
MRRFLAAVFAVALGLALTAPAGAGTETMKEKTKDAAETVKDKTKDAAETVKDKTKAAAEKVKEKASDVKQRMVGPKKDDVMTAQQALKDKGHDPGMIDGRMGPRTRTALKDYQKAEGLKVNGRLDNETRGRLGMPMHTSKMGKAMSPSASPVMAPTPSSSFRSDTDTSSNTPSTAPEEATKEKQKP